MAEVRDLIGKTLTSVKRIGDEEILFSADDGSEFKLYHERDCCESVTIDDVIGDLSDLIGSPILAAEEATSHEGQPPDDDSVTWTFYKFATRKGYVDVRWCGESNGYYSESVDFVRLN